MELTAPPGPTAPPARTGSPVGRIPPPAASRVLHASRRLLGANVLLACHPLRDAPPISVYHRQASPAPSGALRPCASGSSLWVGLVGEPGKTGPQGAPGDTGKTGAAGAIGTSFVRLFVCGPAFAWSAWLAEGRRYVCQANPEPLAAWATQGSLAVPASQENRDIRVPMVRTARQARPGHLGRRVVWASPAPTAPTAIRGLQAPTATKERHLALSPCPHAAHAHTSFSRTPPSHTITHTGAHTHSNPHIRSSHARAPMRPRCAAPPSSAAIMPPPCGWTNRTHLRARWARQARQGRTARQMPSRVIPADLVPQASPATTDGRARLVRPPAAVRFEYCVLEWCHRALDCALWHSDVQRRARPPMASSINAPALLWRGFFHPAAACARSGRLPAATHGHCCLLL